MKVCANWITCLHQLQLIFSSVLENQINLSFEHVGRFPWILKWDLIICPIKTSLHTIKDLIDMSIAGVKLYVIIMSCTCFRVNPLYSCLKVKEGLTWSRHKIWNLSDYNWTQTHNHLVHKQTLNHLVKLV